MAYKYLSRVRYAPVNVRDFGVMADGSTDDSTAINALIVAVNAIGGGVIELPAGTIKCNIVLKPGVILKGRGRGQNASGVGGTPMPPVYTFAGGGTTKQTITGSRGGNAALADLLTKLASLGLITDSTS